jgi:hypothetical protein
MDAPGAKARVPSTVNREVKVRVLSRVSLVAQSAEH